MFSFSFSKNLFLQQLKNFFFVPRSVAEMTETALERRFQWFFILQTAMLLGIIYYVYQAFYLHTDFVIDSQLALIALFAGFFTLYFGVKYGIYKFVNWVFSIVKIMNNGTDPGDCLVPRRACCFSHSSFSSSISTFRSLLPLSTPLPSSFW